MYFITVCTKDKKHLLGEIVGCGDFDTPQMILSSYGKILERNINIMNEKHSYINVDKYVIMPNHFHMILNITDFKSGALETTAPYNSVISKFISLLKRYCNREYGKNIWQTSYNDHIVRGKKDYEKIWEYIDTNVLMWKNDCFYNE